jgi:hypothetical protein
VRLLLCGFVLACMACPVWFSAVTVLHLCQALGSAGAVLQVVSAWQVLGAGWSHALALGVLHDKCLAGCDYMHGPVRVSVGTRRLTCQAFASTAAVLHGLRDKCWVTAFVELL